MIFTNAIYNFQSKRCLNDFLKDLKLLSDVVATEKTGKTVTKFQEPYA